MRISLLSYAAHGLLSLLCISVSVGQESAELEPSGANALTEQDAVNIALEYTGFGELDGFTADQISAPILTVADHDSRSPVSTSLIEGKTAWLVRFSDVVMQLPNTKARSRQETPKSFDVLIDHETGQLLKVSYGYDWKEAGFTCDPWSRLLVGAKRPHRETMLTQQQPPSNLCAALRKRFQFDPFVVKEFEAYCVEFHWPDPDEKPFGMPFDSVPVWLVVTRDFILVQPAHDSLARPSVQREYIEYRLVDVTTDEPRLVIISEPAKGER